MFTIIVVEDVMGKIFFVRHGQSEFNAGLTAAFNSEITPKGMDQATRAAMMLRDEIRNPEEFTGLVSPYIRCLQTALVIHKYTGIKFKVDHRVGETPEEVHRTQSAAIYTNSNHFPDFDWSRYATAQFLTTVDYTGETEEVYRRRLDDFLKVLKDDAHYVIVSHMTPTVHMIREICFEGKRENITIGNCSISLIEDRKPVYIGNIP